MISLLGWRAFAWAIAVITVLSGAAQFPFNPPKDVLDFIGLFSKFGIVSALLIAVIGQSPVFPWLCSRWPLNLVLPDIHGSWSGLITSNWPAIAESHGIKNPDESAVKSRPTPVTVDIHVQLFSISMELKSDSSYQESKTLSCSIRKNSHKGFEFSYIYRSSVHNPKPTDEQSFLGAAFFDFSSRKPRELKGVYWTNRKWKEGLNTAGVIALERGSRSKGRG